MASTIRGVRHPWMSPPPTSKLRIDQVGPCIPHHLRRHAPRGILRSLRRGLTSGRRARRIGRASARLLFLDADIPALLRKRALEALGGQLESERDISTIRQHGVDIPRQVNEIEYNVLTVVAFAKGPSRVDRSRGASRAASYFERALLE